MKQTKTISLIETLMNIGSGWIISTATWMIVGPLFGYTVALTAAGGFAAIFTVVSIIRSYFWRRLFESRLNSWLHKVVHNEVDSNAKIRREV